MPEVLEAAKVRIYGTEESGAYTMKRCPRCNGPMPRNYDVSLCLWCGHEEELVPVYHPPAYHADWPPHANPAHERHTLKLIEEES